MSTCPGCVVVEDTKTRTTLSSIIATGSRNNGGDVVGSNRNDHVDDNDDDDDDRIILCPSCVHASLQYVQERHQSAKLTWYESRKKCAEYFQQKHNPNESKRNKSIYILDQKYQQLRKELEQLQHECSTTTMETCSMNLRIMERQEYLSTLQNQYATQRRQILSKLQQTLCGYNNNHTTGTNDTADNNNSTNDNDNSNPNNNTSTCRQNVTGALIHNIDMTKRMVRVLRFQWTLQAFQMFRIQIDDEDTKVQDDDNDDNDQNTNSNNTSDGTTIVNDAISTKQHQQQRRNTRRRNGTKNMIVSGIGKICGLPLPHAGLELYGVLPYEELQSALRLVAQLTYLIARCLYIPLPHPIIIVPPPPPPSSSSSPLSSPSSKSTLSGKSPQQHKQHVKSLYMGDIADSVFHDYTDHDYRDGSYNTSTNIGSNRDVITSSLTSLSSFLVGGESRQPSLIQSKNETIPSPQRHFTHQRPQHQKSLLSTDPHQVEQRIRHAVSAIIAEDQSCKTFYTLSTDIKQGQQINTTINTTAISPSVGANTSSTSTTTSTTNVTTQQQQNDEFAIALQLLQNNILVICINVGVPIHQLYPGEAILLNLYTLQQFCYHYIL
jgi:hypothetical protein